MSEEIKVKKPGFLTEEELVDTLIYLDGLRESGEVNMFGAGAYLEAWFAFTKRESSIILKYWIKTFDSRQKALQDAEDG